AGRVVGKTDKVAGDVADTPVSPKDVQATVYHLLGIDPSTTLTDRLGRPMPVAGEGRGRPEVLGGAAPGGTSPPGRAGDCSNSRGRIATQRGDEDDRGRAPRPRPSPRPPAAGRHRPDPSRRLAAVVPPDGSRRAGGPVAARPAAVPGNGGCPGWIGP